jgi:NCAIR mutase (PurE)-related protein
MRPTDLRALLQRVVSGDETVDGAAAALATLPFEDLGFATVDHHREIRTGYPEVVYGSGKSVEQIAGIVDAIVARGQRALVTRIEEAKARHVLALLSVEARAMASVEPLPRFLFVGRPPEIRGRETIAVVSAGTADLPVFEEAARTAELLGNEVIRVNDVGVAGLHRVVAHRAALEKSAVVVVVAGMEGALPSVVAGLISRPVIAVPTSIGSGASFGGVAALLAMLNSCASGVTVVNIDNGFGAGFAASLINMRRDR